jgi:predicted nucleic acid-binding protein
LLKKYLDTREFCDLKKAQAPFGDSAKMYLKLRKKGVKVKSMMDCLVAEAAIENHLFLLHNDKDFTRISGHFLLNMWSA